MFTQNETMVDRIIRVVVGALLIYAWYAMLAPGIMAIAALIIGIVLVITGLVGWCPLYSLFGIGARQSTP
ncbi:MAG: DUF2892 domain-containing protein [Caldilineaceae bacterium]|nr:DUF2892 domain-containing protein [Caldilineaceae bacterium]